MADTVPGLLSKATHKLLLLAHTQAGAINDKKCDTQLLIYLFGLATSGAGVDVEPENAPKRGFG